MACDRDAPVDDERPFRDAWQVAAVVDFVHMGADGEPLISELAIGGVGGENFSNRGDVIVRYDGAPDTMTIELRRFVPASTEQSAREQMDIIELWAFEGSLALPGHKDAEEECLDRWRAGCQIRVFQDALSQRGVAGADIRVTLPPDFRGKLDIETEDDAAAPDYFNRADVCIEGLPGSAEISMQSGRAWVRLADDITPTPTCPAEDVAACEAWTTPDTDGQPIAVPWSPECTCLAEGHVFGGVVIDSRDVDATDVKVDIPAGLWTSLQLQNRLDGGLDRECVATLDLPSERLELEPVDSRAEARGYLNFPGEPATGGAGYRVSLESGTCGPVAFTPGPDEYAGPGNGESQDSERRGFLEVCTDCIPQGCAELVP